MAHAAMVESVASFASVACAFSPSDCLSANTAATRDADELGLIHVERRALRRRAMVINPAAAPVRGERSVVPLCGDARLIKPRSTATGTAAVVRKPGDDLVVEAFEQPRIAVVLEA